MNHLNLDDLEQAAREIDHAECHEPFSDGYSTADRLEMNAQAEHDQDNGHEHHINRELSVDCILLLLVNGRPEVREGQVPEPERVHRRVQLLIVVNLLFGSLRLLKVLSNLLYLALHHLILSLPLVVFSYRRRCCIIILIDLGLLVALIAQPNSFTNLRPIVGPSRQVHLPLPLDGKASVLTVDNRGGLTNLLLLLHSILNLRS